jgi:hypothetical protein
MPLAEFGASRQDKPCWRGLIVLKSTVDPPPPPRDSILRQIGGVVSEIYTGFIVVRLAPLGGQEADVEIANLRSLASERRLGKLSELLEPYADADCGRLISADPRQILELDDRAAEMGPRPGHSLASYWRIDARSNADPDALVQRLNELDSIDFAYRELRGADPGTPAASLGQSFKNRQFHLEPGPVGVDGQFALDRADGAGASVRFVDVEQGWMFDHENLPDIVRLPGVNIAVRPDGSRGSSRIHGTAVLGLVAGKNNGIGTVGIARKPLSVSVSSHFRSDLGTGDHVANAIFDVLRFMQKGDVLLVEWQDALLRPADASPAIGHVIKRACDVGIIVLESAGNGDATIDAIPFLNRNDTAQFKDSGAIVVGACASALNSARTGHDRWFASNSGSRVDCHAFGENVVTAGPPGAPGGLLGSASVATRQYRQDFMGTSAAAAIVAGVAVALQGMHKSVKGRPLTPAEMRTVLSTHGTPQGTGTAGKIGVMPDLKKAAAALQL